MRIDALRGAEARFRSWRDRRLGAWLFKTQLLSKAFMRFLGRRGDLIVRRLTDHRLAVDPGDHTVAWRIIRKGSWQRDELEGAIAFAWDGGWLKPGGVFADIGANIGSQTIYGMLSGQFSRAIAVEPVPANLELLRLNLHLNGLTDRVHVADVAAGAASGKIGLSVSGHNFGGHSSRKVHADGTRIEVDVERFDDLLDQAGLESADIGLVWIDAEGAEPDVLAGMPEVLAQAPPLVLEWSPEINSSSERQVMVTLLSRHYVSFIDIHGGPAFGPDAPLQPISALRDIAGQTDVLCLAEPSGTNRLPG